jgi:hypothetical protein
LITAIHMSIVAFSGVNRFAVGVGERSVPLSGYARPVRVSLYYSVDEILRDDEFARCRRLDGQFYRTAFEWLARWKDDSTKHQR